MVLCVLVPLFSFAALAADAEDLPIDYRFEDVDADGAQVLAAGLTNDPYSSKQWGMKMIGMEAAWQSGLTGRGVRVAVIDGGVYTNTGEFDADRLLPGKNMIEEGGSTEDSNGHGTFIAGIIGAAKDNGVGIAGVAPGVTIVPIKTTDGSDTQNGVSAQAFYAAVDEFHCDVINYSSAGNDGSTTLYYPGALEDTIGVGSINKGMERSDFSHRNKSIFVVAPGEDVYSLGQGGSVRSSSGTSFSAPFVAGLAALLKEAHPEMNTADFKAILQASSKDLGDAGYDVEYGYGLIQVPAAIRAAAEYFGTTAPDMPEIPEPTPEPGYNQTIWDQLFNFSWLRDFFQNIIRNLFKGWTPNLTF